MRNTLVVLAVAALVAGPVQAAPTSRTSDLKGPAGAKLGTVSVTEAPGGVIVRIAASGLTPGWHGAHFHEKGDCSDAAFKKSGGHVHGVAPAVHGLLNPALNESGDLPNIFAASDGKANAELYSTFVSLSGTGSRASLLDADGSALVIHAGSDDYSSQPIGGAGDRVACAVLK